MLQAVRGFFDTGYLDPKLNKSHNSLIPKVPNPKCLDQLKLFNLCNFGYKIFSNVLANSLRPWLPEINVGEQNVFVVGRQIQENILIV